MGSHPGGRPHLDGSCLLCFFFYLSTICPLLVLPPRHDARHSHTDAHAHTQALHPTCSKALIAGSPALPYPTLPTVSVPHCALTFLLLSFLRTLSIAIITHTSHHLFHQAQLIKPSPARAKSKEPPTTPPLAPPSPLFNRFTRPPSRAVAPLPTVGQSPPPLPLFARR